MFHPQDNRIAEVVLAAADTASVATQMPAIAPLVPQHQSQPASHQRQLSTPSMSSVQRHDLPTPKMNASSSPSAAQNITQIDPMSREQYQSHMQGVQAAQVQSPTVAQPAFIMQQHQNYHIIRPEHVQPQHPHHFVHQQASSYPTQSIRPDQAFNQAQQYHSPTYHPQPHPPPTYGAPYAGQQTGVYPGMRRGIHEQVPHPASPAPDGPRQSNTSTPANLPAPYGI
jgi:hypothetical protein